MAKFTRESRGLVLQDEDGVWAHFVGGEFETEDAKVAARLRKVDGVTEAKAKSDAKSDGDK